MKSNENNKKQTVSLCMVIKDEEETLERAIRSVLPAVDEIVIGIDDATKDKSETIARRFTDKVYRFKWENDFSKARNRMLVHCTKDWVLQLDGHEFLNEKSLPLFRRMLENLPENVDAVGFRLRMQKEDGNYSGIQLRLFRNNGEIHYRNSVHNVLDADNSKTIGFSDIVIEHSRPVHNRENRSKQRNSMVPENMQEALRKDPTDTRALYYLGVHAQDDGDYAKAIACCQRYLAYSKHPEERYKVLWQMGRCLYLYGKKDRARKAFVQGITERYDMAECYISLGELAMEEEKWDEAEHYFKLACGRKLPMSGVFFSEDFYSWLPCHKLCELYDKSGEHYKAICAGEELLKFDNLPVERKKEIEKRFLYWYNSMLDKLTIQTGSIDKKNVLIVDRTGQFTKELKDRLSGNYNVVLLDRFSPQHCRWADVIWFDWCDENLVTASQVRWDAAVIAMLRSYEYFAKYPCEVNWRNVDKVLFVSDRMKAVSLKKFPSIKQAGPEVLRDGIDIQSLTFKERAPGNNIAWVGFLNHKKNVPLLLDLATRHPDREFHIAGSFQDERLEHYVSHFLGMNRVRNVHLHGWVDDIDAFLDNMNYILSTSIWEGTHLAVLEGMAKGLMPLVHFWPGAHEIYRTDWLFRNSSEFRQILTNSKYDSASYRRYVEDNFSMETRLVKLEEIITSLINKKGGVKHAQLQQ